MIDIEKIKKDGIERELKSQMALRFDKIKACADQMTPGFTASMVTPAVEQISDELWEIKQLEKALNDYLCENF